MALTIETAALHAIADHPEAFPAAKKDIDAFLNKVIAKQLKAPKLDLASFKNVYNLIREPNVLIVLESEVFKEKDLLSLVKKIDKNAEMLRGAPILSDVRDHIKQLGRGTIEPSAAPPPKPPKKAANSGSKQSQADSKIGDVLGSKVHSGQAGRGRARKS